MAINTQHPPQELGKHSFDGAYAPGMVYMGSVGQIGFSLGVFQWLAKSGGKGLKKSAVKIRVKGYIRDAEKVYNQAREICRRLDAGEVIGQKSISVK